MKRLQRRVLLQGALASAACACASPPGFAAEATERTYICPPCGCAMDGVKFSAPGNCPACGMTLTPEEDLRFEPTALAAGAGAFLTAGGQGREDKRITVHYYKPRRFTPRSRVLIVLAGAGRNGDSYRDAWIDAAESANALVAALSYPEADYDFAAYHMGGVVSDLVIRNLPEAETPSVIHARDEDISFTVNPRRETWLFHDFDRIFTLLAGATGSERTGYDMFGHSAGGQILHRLALFHPRSRAERIVAANSGFYTLPDTSLPLPVGLAGTGIDDASLADSFACRMTLLLGENDDGDEAGGIQIHTPMIDRQGIGRLARGRYFFRAGQERARAMGAALNWTLRTVPNVGHDFRAMSRAAAALLYEA
jgi:pimeloyl-ACP methyl ester carboxylesterase